MLLVTLALGISSLNSISKLNGRFEVALNKTARKIVLSDTVSTAKSDMFAAQRGVVAFTFGNFSAGVQKCHKQFESAAQRWTESLSELRPLLITEEGKELTDRSEAGLHSWRAIFGEVEQVSASGNPEAALKIFMERGIPLYEAIAKDTQRLQELQRQLLEADRRAAADTNNLSRWIAIALVGLSLIRGAVILLVVRSTSRTLQKAAAEIGEGAEQINAAAAQVASSSQSLAQGASEQAASLEETSASTEEITSMTRKNAENSKSAADVMATVDHEVKWAT